MDLFSSDLFQYKCGLNVKQKSYMQNKLTVQSFETIFLMKIDENHPELSQMGTTNMSSGSNTYRTSPLRNRGLSVDVVKLCTVPPYEVKTDVHS